MEPSYQQTGCVRPASGWETVGEDPCKHLHYLPCLPWGLTSEIFCCCSRGVRAATGSPADWFYSDVKTRVWPIDSAQGSPQFPSSVDTCVSNCSSPKRCAVSNYRLTTSLSDVLTLLLISFTVMCTQEHTAGRDDSSNLVLQPHFLWLTDSSLAAQQLSLCQYPWILQLKYFINFLF